MIVTVIYYEESSKAPKLLTFESIEKAKDWLSNDKVSLHNKQNPRIMVDYSAVETYKEMYELMKDQVFGNRSLKEKKMIKEI